MILVVCEPHPIGNSRSRRTSRLLCAANPENFLFFKLFLRVARAPNSLQLRQRYVSLYTFSTSSRMMR